MPDTDNLTPCNNPPSEMGTEGAGLTLEEDMAAHGYTPGEIALYKADPAEFNRRMAAEMPPLPEDPKPAKTAPPPTPWQPLRRFADEAKAEPFPAGCLPAHVADMINALALEMQTDPSMPGLLALGVLAVCCQSWARVEVRPGSWPEQLSLYVAAVADPGERKSPTLKKLTRQLLDYEAERREQERAEISANRDERDALEQKLKRAKSAVASGKGGMQAVRYLSGQLANYPNMYPYRLVVDDITQEALVSEMARQNGCLSIVSAEGGVFGMMQGRYSQMANYDVYTKSYVGDPVKVDRIGRDGADIPHPRLTMVLCVQPEVLQEIMADKQARGRGLCGRFLFAVCASKVGYRKVSPPIVSADTQRRYDATISNLLARSTGPEVLLTLSPAAMQLREALQEAVEEWMRPDGKLADLKDWATKCTGTCCRIAALLHLADDAEVWDPGECRELDPEDETATDDNQITAPQMQRAATIISCLVDHARRAYGAVDDADEQLARKAAVKLEAANKSELTRRELRRMLHCTADEMADALDELEDRGYIRVKSIKPVGRGRATEIIECNPEIWKTI